MEEEAEEIESLDPQEEKEEPWCVVCREYTDYRRKWNTLPRANLDGGTYSENVESPHCVECENQMIYLSHCKLITRFFWVAIKLSPYGVIRGRNFAGRPPVRQALLVVRKGKAKGLHLKKRQRSLENRSEP